MSSFPGLRALARPVRLRRPGHGRATPGRAPRGGGRGDNRVAYVSPLPRLLGVVGMTVGPVLASLHPSSTVTVTGTRGDLSGRLIHLTGQENRAAPPAPRTFLGARPACGYDGVFAMSVLSPPPLFPVFLSAQRRLPRGIATTGTK